MEKQNTNYPVKFTLLPVKEYRRNKIGSEYQATVCYIVAKAFIAEEYKVHMPNGETTTTYKVCFPHIVSNERVNHYRKYPNENISKDNELVVSKLFDNYEDAVAEKEAKNIFANPEVIKKYSFAEAEILDITQDLIVKEDNKTKIIGQK